MGAAVTLHPQHGPGWGNSEDPTSQLRTLRHKDSKEPAQRPWAGALSAPSAGLWLSVQEELEKQCLHRPLSDVRMLRPSRPPWPRSLLQIDTV